MSPLDEFHYRVGRFFVAEHLVQAVPEVTLCCADCVDPQAGAYALALSMRGFAWGRVILFSDERPAWLPTSPTAVEWVPIPKLTSLDAYNTFCLRDLHAHIRTPHVLSVQADGWMLRPDLWDFDWLTWDYIGAPWKARPMQGNSGFCLRSKKLLEATSAMFEPYASAHVHQWGQVLDDMFCCQFRPQLEALDLRFAPLTVAGRFSLEERTPWTAVRTFGFHHYRRNAHAADPDLAWLHANTTQLGQLLREK